MRDRKSNRLIFGLTPSSALIFLATICCLVYLVGFGKVGHAANESPKNLQDQAKVESAKSHPPQGPKAFALIKASERRSYENKMMSRELIRYVKAITIILALIGVSFPFCIWLLSKRRILRLSGLSGEVAATLLAVEERQAKLANILKDIQGEIDYLHTMSVPDLKNLIEQAEKYLKQNEQDLEKAGLAKDKKSTRA
jgi:hypothetical protein